jgi:hypothetical protein
LRAILLTAVAILLSAPFVAAQESVHAGAAFDFLLVNDQLAPFGERDIAIALRQFVSTQTSTFPVATSSAGFSYTFDPKLQIPVRNTRSFGPLFAQRPLPGGRGRWSLNLNFQRSTWSAVGMNDWQDPGLRVNAWYPTGGRNQWTSRIELRTATTVLGVSYGLSNSVDVGASIPFISVGVAGELALERFDPAGVGERQSTTARGESFGLGDIVIRTKVSVHGERRVQTAVAAELRCPTGDETKLLGAGTLAPRALLIGGMDFENLSVHYNLGYIWAGRGVRFSTPSKPLGKVGDPVPLDEFPHVYLAPDLYEVPVSRIEVEPSNEFTYSVGADVAISDRVTGAFDLIGRWLKDSAELVDIAFRSPVTRTVILQPFLSPRNVNLLVGVAGAKVSFANNWLLTANLLIPMGEGGLRPNVSSVVGVERAF